MTRRTVESHLTSVYQRLGIERRAQLPALRRAASATRPRTALRLVGLGGFGVERNGVHVPQSAFGREHYGEASATTGDGRVFFERRYTGESIDDRLLGMPRDALEREYGRMRFPQAHRGFAVAASLSYLFGFALRWLSPRNFALIESPRELRGTEMGVAYLKLRKQGGDA